MTATTVDVLKLMAAMAISLLPAVVGLYVAPGPWYESLRKPPFHPPDWLFAPAWTALYPLMGVAAFLVWRWGVAHPSVRMALGLFLLQLILNALWTPVFFGMQSVGGSLVVIVGLWFVLLLTVIWFFRISAWAGMLLLPYILWVTFAAGLNASLFMLNR